MIKLLTINMLTQYCIHVTYKYYELMKKLVSNIMDVMNIFFKFSSNLLNAK